MSCFIIPKWRYIAITEEQRKKLAEVDVQALVKSWEEKKLPRQERIWFLKQEIQVSTFIEQTADLEKEVLHIDIPPGVMCMHTPPQAQNLLCETNVALHELFKHLTFRGLNANPKTKLTMFDRIPKHPHVAAQIASPKEIREYLRSNAQFEVIDRFWLVYLEKLAQHFCLSVDELISDDCHMSILQYEDRGGFFLHIDNILRTDATVFSVGVGRPVVYDMTRVLGRNKRDDVCIVRSSNPEGTMMVLDGEARYKWAHSIPAAHTHNGVKYTLVLRIANTTRPVRPIGKCIEFNTEIYSIASSEPEHEKTESNPHMHAQHDSFLDGSLLGLLMQLENTCIDTHI
ncbi:MAG: hypothetical protein EBW68_10800, partial [Actinobacteria bacterium]|nr:hypothetical protein [Actinomycetota bacterium]